MTGRPIALLVGLAFVILTAPLAAAAQPASIPRVGVLTPEPFMVQVRDGLRELGYFEGQNIAIDWRWAHGDPRNHPALAAELVRLRVNVIVAGSNSAIQAAQHATRTIPVVMLLATDPVATGFVVSLARPGGNITGLTLQAEFSGKDLQFLKEAIPNLSRIGLLWTSNEPGRHAVLSQVQAAARALGLEAEAIDVQSEADVERAFATLKKEHVGGVYVVGSSTLFTQRARITELTTEYRLPLMCYTRLWVGCLMSYGPNFLANARRGAYFVDRILKGAKPEDLPVEQPTKFELVVNLKTAKALGLTIPPSLLLRAD